MRIYYSGIIDEHGKGMRMTSVRRWTEEKLRIFGAHEFYCREYSHVSDMYDDYYNSSPL
jgi:hypothetical protein